MGEVSRRSQSSRNAAHRTLPESPAPPASPRPLASGVRATEPDRRRLWFGALLALSLAPILIPLFADPSDSLGQWTDGLALLPWVVLAAFTAGSFGRGLCGRSKRRRVYRIGEIAVASVDRVTKAYYPQEDGSSRQTSLIEWEFQVDGVVVRGSRESKGEAIAAIRQRETMWVLYDPKDPADNVEWPPL